MLVSGEMDKAILAFEVAAGFAALGMSVQMWFVLYGVNCLKNHAGVFRRLNGSGRQTAVIRDANPNRIHGYKILSGA